MKDEALGLLRELADKLGTTTEYLWGILVKQAPISGIVDVLTFAALVVVTIVLARLTRSVMEKDYYPGLQFWLALAALISFFITVVYGTASLATGIYGLLNPEYWALLQVLKIK